MITLFRFWKLMTTNATYHEYLIAEELLIMNRNKGCVQTMWPYEFRNNVYNFGHQKNCTNIKDNKDRGAQVYRTLYRNWLYRQTCLVSKQHLHQWHVAAQHTEVLFMFSSASLWKREQQHLSILMKMCIDQKKKKLGGWQESSSENLMKRMKRM